MKHLCDRGWELQQEVSTLWSYADDEKELTGCSPGYRGSLTLQLKEGQAVSAYWIGKQSMVHSCVQEAKQRCHR